MKQIGLLTVLAALVIADIDIRNPSRGWGTSPTFFSTTDPVENPCDYVNNILKIHQDLQCEIVQTETNSFGNTQILGQTYQNVVIEPAVMKVNRNSNGETIFSGLLYTTKPNQRGIISGSLNSNRLKGESGRERPQGILYSDAVSAARLAFSNSLEESGQKPDPISMEHGSVDHDIVFTAKPGQINKLRVSYKVSLRVPTTRQDAVVYIDADTKQTVWIHTQSLNIQGTTDTNYYGKRPIEVTQVGDTYVAAQEGNRHMNLNKCDPDFAQCYYYAVYEPVTSDHKDEFGTGGDDEDKLTSPYYSAQQVWDYFAENYGHASWDGNGAEIKIFGLDMQNAFWTVWQGAGETYYGYKTGTDLGSFDVVAHELTHGVIQGTANLVYAYESGALNQGFADAFGLLIYQEVLNRPNEWIIGTESPMFSRSISNPKDSYNPDTYKGQYWHTGESDNGGVHTNSGVFAHIFYMLSAGKSGQNDHGKQYDVSGIGNDKTGKIMYRALSGYLTPNSEYLDARQAMLQAASDWYGQNSYEYEQVQEAFLAGGVYRRFNFNLELNSLQVAVLIVVGLGASVALYQVLTA